MANILPDGGQGIGVNPEGTDYPFTRPSPDVKGILADAYIAHEDAGITLPLHLVRLSGFGAAFLGQSTRCDVEIRDALGALVFDSTTADRYAARLFGQRLKIHEWYSATVACRVVQHTAFPDPQRVVAIPDIIVPVDGTLDERVGEVLCRRAARIRDPDVGTVVAGDLIFADGYNATMDIVPTTRGLRVITQIFWAARPDSGLGRYPGCAAPDLVLRSFNKVGPAPDGDFQLGAEGCYWVRQPTDVHGWPRVSVPVPATLHVGNDCGPCCECDDFVRVQRGVLRTWGRFVGIAQGAETTRDVFRDMIALWREEKACIESRVVTLVLAPFGTQYVEVLASVCNHTRYCLYDVTMVLGVDTSPGPGQVMSGTTRISALAGGLVPYQMAGTWPSWVAYFDAIQAMSSGVVRTRLWVPAATIGAAITVRATASTDSPLAGLQLPQSVVQTATFGA